MPPKVVLGQRCIEGTGEPATAADRDVVSGSESSWGQGSLGEVMILPDRRHHTQCGEYLHMGFGIWVVNGTDFQIDPPVTECGSSLQLLCPESERDPRRFLLS
ncbi:Uncharacterised protein [Mycolicibacterium aurum]|uniref:Uncharacterized protein n=1 Tax=Mycolicibacterium aurum TaxID=1791 RepID=A0A448J214_MYCAU|nr:Uncharacterised protein [Mycolicibacterium aurum]